MNRIEIDHSWYAYPDLPIAANESAGGVVVRPSETGYWVALVQEGQQHNDAYILPKGRLEPGETIETAARREIAEEAGLTELKLLQKLGVRDRFNLRKTAWKTIHYFLFETTQIEGTPTDTTYNYQLHWFPLQTLPPVFWPEQQEMLDLTVRLLG